MPDPVCQVCRSAAAQRPFFAHHGRELLRCGGCGFIYLHPLPAAEVLGALYTDPYHGATTGYFAKVEKKMKRSRGRARALARVAGGGRFLDVGCSGGFMAEAMRKAGFESHGLDLDREAIRYASKHFPECRFYNEPVERFAARGFAFDAVYSSEVIEHVVDLDGFVGAIARLIKPGGVFYVTTPDIAHWRRPRDLTRWDGYCPPSHCLYFSPPTLKRLMSRHGLALLRRRLSFKPGIKMLFRRTPWNKTP